MEKFDIIAYVKRRTEEVFSTQYSVENGKCDFYPGLIQHTRLLTGSEYISEIVDMQNA
jgi:hypothetical protein